MKIMFVNAAMHLTHNFYIAFVKLVTELFKKSSGVVMNMEGLRKILGGDLDPVGRAEV